MLISDFPFVRSVHLLGNVYLALYFRHTDGWRWMEGEIVPYEKAEHKPRTTFSAAKFHEDRPTKQGTNDVETRVNVLSIGYRKKSRKSGHRGRFPQVFRLSP